MQQRLLVLLFLHSISGCVGPDLHVQSDEKNFSQRWLFWTLPGHLAKLHESHSCCQHQLRGLRVHEDWPRNLQMMLELGGEKKKPMWLEEKKPEIDNVHTECVPHQQGQWVDQCIYSTVGCLSAGKSFIKCDEHALICIFISVFSQTLFNY